MTVNVNPGKQAIRKITYAVCANCGKRVKFEDGQPVQTCCGNFVKE